MKSYLSTSLATYLALSTSLAVIGSGGCHSFEDIQPLPFMEQSADGGSCPKLPDMGVPPTQTCKAAQGLAGEVKICVDFNQATLADLSGKGWDFDKFDKSCWEIANGKLQIKNFSTFMSSCGFLMPALSASDYQKYGSFTLAVAQTVDLNAQQQRAQVLLGLDDPDSRLLTQITGRQPRHQWVQTIAKTALPNGGGNQYQPLFKLTSGAFGSGYQGWQIESIAVLGNLQ